MSSLRPESRLIALIVATAFFMQMLDTSIMNTSLPQMARSFGVMPLDLSVGITLYMLTSATLVPLSGWLADRFGARRIFIVAMAIFTAASLACGFATSVWQFSLARAVQGIGGALMTPVGRMIVLHNAAKHEIIHATALITWPALAAPIIGPALGGFITTYISWRWNFLLNVPLGLAGIWLVLRHVPDMAGEHPRPLDWTGFVLASGALGLLLYALEWLSHAQAAWATYQWLTPLLLTLLGTGLGVLAVRHFHRHAQPLLELSALSVLTYRLSTLSAGTAFRTTLHATPYLLPLMFQVGFGLSALASGSLLLMYFVGNLGIKPITTAVLQRFGFRSVLVVNGCMAGLGIMACAWFSAATAKWIIMAVLVYAGATRSMQLTCLNTLAFADTTPAQRSSSSTLFSMFNLTSAVLGVAVSTLVVNLSLLTEPQVEAGLREIRIGLVAMGVLAMASALMFLRLPRDAGAEVSGHDHTATRQGTSD